MAKLVSLVMIKVRITDFIKCQISASICCVIYQIRGIAWLLQEERKSLCDFFEMKYKTHKFSNFHKITNSILMQ